MLTFAAGFGTGAVVLSVFWLLFYGHNRDKWARAAEQMDLEARHLVTRIAALERKVHGE